MGILFAITALLAWGLGDFLLQRSTRRFGEWLALFYITAFGAIALTPFVYTEIPHALATHGWILAITALVMLIASILNLKALEIGKLSVIEPIFAFEIPVSALLAGFVLGEHISFAQGTLIAAIVVGIFLISTRSLSSFKNAQIEKGTWYAAFGTISMGAASFLFGVSARDTNPLMINWFANIFLVVISFSYLVAQRKISEIRKGLRNHGRLILNVSFFDNLAWVAFSYAMLYIPIAIATGISEGYIAFAGALGLLFNREKLKQHQLVGFGLAVIAVIALAVITDH